MKEGVDVIVGRRLRARRRLLGLTQQQLSAKTGLRQETISVIETGNPASRIETLLAVLSALDLEFQIGPRSKDWRDTMVREMAGDF